MTPRWKSLKADCQFCGSALQETYLKGVDLHIVRCTGRECKTEWRHNSRDRLMEVLGIEREEQ